MVRIWFHEIRLTNFGVKLFSNEASTRFVLDEEYTIIMVCIVLYIIIIVCIIVVSAGT